MFRNLLMTLVVTCTTLSSLHAQEFRTLPGSPFVTPFPSRPQVADLDGSGLPDIVFVDNYDVKAIFNLDMTSPAPAPVLLASFAQTSFFIPVLREMADLDNDGDLDVLVSRSTGFFTPTFAYVIENLGNGGGWAPERSLFPYSGKSDTLRTGDFNSDGRLDIVSSVNGAGSFGDVEVFLQDANGGFNSAHFEVDGGFNYAVGDFNADGVDDIFFVSRTAGQGRIILGSLNGTFAPGPVFATVANARSCISTGDLNGDGIADLMVAGTPVGGGQISLQSFYGNASNVLAPGPVFMSTSGSSGMLNLLKYELLDMDSDGFRDLVVTFFSPGVEFVAFRGDGTGSYSSDGLLLFDAPEPASPALQFAGLLDLDQDGDLDGFRRGPTANELTRLDNRALYGAPCSGTAGDPALSVGIARPGNQAFALTMDGALANAPAEFYISSGDTQAPCGVLFDVSALVLPSTLGQMRMMTDANGSVTLPIPLPLGMAPQMPFYIQGAVLDPAGTFQAGFASYAATQGRALRIF